MLSALIFGVACGGLWLYHRIDMVSEPEGMRGWGQSAVGMGTLSTLYLYGPRSTSCAGWCQGATDKSAPIMQQRLERREKLAYVFQWPRPSLFREMLHVSVAPTWSKKNHDAARDHSGYPRVGYGTDPVRKALRPPFSRF